jgi:hypothetical protein
VFVYCWLERRLISLIQESLLSKNSDLIALISLSLSRMMETILSFLGYSPLFSSLSFSWCLVLRVNIKNPKFQIILLARSKDTGDGKIVSVKTLKK